MILALNWRTNSRATSFDGTGVTAVRSSKITVALVVLFLYATLHCLSAQTPATPVPAQGAPTWAQPGSATHTQVAPPAEFHRPSKNFDTPIGVFQGQSDIGDPLVPGSASFNATLRRYTINSAGYNIWYTRDEFRYLWKKMSGDVSLAADVAFPDPNGYGDRKAVLIIRQDLDDDSKEAIVALHGAGMIHLAQRAEKGVRVKDMEYRIGGRGRPGAEGPDSLVNLMAKRIGIEKRGDSFSLYVSLEGEPMHQFGPPIQLHLEGPFYVGIGFCSHLPDKSDTAVLSNTVLENSAGMVH
ncbi:MAG: biopolymer transporter Tol [Terracidiphilus sp.]